MEAAAIDFMVKLFTTAEVHHVAVILLTLAVTPFGVVGLVVYLWIGSERRRNETIKIYRDDLEKTLGEFSKANTELLRAYREDTKKILEAYGKDFESVSAFYRSNVELVNSWKRIAEGFQETVVLNTATMQRMCDLMQTNQFCPLARLPK